MTDHANRTGDVDAAAAVMDAALRAKSPAERLAIVDGMWRSAQSIISRRLRSDHPEWTHEQIARATARRLSHGAV